MRNKVPTVALLFCLLATTGFATQQILSPSEYIGKPIGADGVLADYEEIKQYFSYLESVSPSIDVINLGTTTCGDELLMAVTSTPENLADSNHYRQISQNLRDAEITPDVARKYAREGKLIVLDMCCIHSDEIASSQMALELAYRIAIGDPEIMPSLEDVILLIIPAVNPDGQKMICNWYEQWKGTEYDGCWMPKLYHPYAGHDNNRDWYMFNLKETRLISQVMYETWIPQVILDHHEMWMTGARYFIPPYVDPVNPNIDPLVWREIDLIGAGIRMRMQERGFKGVVSSALFSGWWEGASVMTPLWHNVPSLLTEAATVRIASPVYVDPSELRAGGTGFPAYMRLSNFPDPWEGGWWHLRDIIDYELTSVIGALEVCATNKERLLYNFYSMCSSQIEKGKKGHPYAYVIPPQQDAFARARMIERLLMGGVQVDIALEKFEADGRVFPKGSYVIYMAQPYRPYAKDILERQHYPEIRLTPEAPPLRPYDATAWTMPLKMDLECYEIPNPFEVATAKCERAEYPQTIINYTSGRFLVMQRNTISSYIFLSRALKNRLTVYTNPESITVEASTLPPGSIFVDLGKRAQATIEVIRKLADGLSLKFIGADCDQSKLKRMRMPRIGVFQPYLPREPEGWLRYVLDDFEYQYTILHNEDMKKESVLKHLDVVIFPDVQASVIKEGKPGGEWARYFEMPPEPYRGGIGDEGVKNLKAFIEKGGTVIAIAASCDLIIDEFHPPVTRLISPHDENSFSCPGAILQLHVDPTSPICYGMNPRTPCFFFYGMAFSTHVPHGKFDREVPARYAKPNLLLSGWMKGQKQIEGKPAVVRVRYESGNMILMGFDPAHRAQTYSTYEILFNSILLGGMAK